MRPITRSPRPPLSQDAMEAYLAPVAQVMLRDLAQRHAAREEEAQTNKAYHLGTKQYEYLDTLTGHIPALLPKIVEGI